MREINPLFIQKKLQNAIIICHSDGTWLKFISRSRDGIPRTIPFGHERKILSHRFVLQSQLTQHRFGWIPHVKDLNYPAVYQTRRMESEMIKTEYETAKMLNSRVNLKLVKISHPFQSGNLFLDT